MAELSIRYSSRTIDDLQKIGDSDEKFMGNKPTLTTYTSSTPTKLGILERDIWDVKKLKRRIPVQQKEPSAAVQRMRETRREHHELSNSNMWRDICIVNEITEKCFTKISDHFKKLLESFKIALINMEKAILEQEHVILYSKQDFLQAMNDAKKLFAYRRNIVDLYCQRLMEVEQTRSEKIKMVLRFYMNSFNKISHLMPRDIQVFFEYQILSYNQAMMENVRYYGEIHLQLVMSGNYQFLKLKRKIDYLEDQWEHHQKQKRRMSECVESSRRRYSGACASLSDDDSDDIRCQLRGDSWTELLFQGIVCKWAEEPDMPHLLYSLNEWSEQLLRILMHLDLCAQKIIFLTKNALLNLLKGLALDFECLNYATLFDDFCKSNNIHDVHLITAAIISKIKAKTLSEPQEYEDEAYDVQNLVLQMEQNNDITADFLISAAKLWDSHFRRTNKCSRLVACGVNRLNEDRKEIDSLEISFNTELDRLRQESEIDNLEMALKNVHQSLDKIQNYYESACEAEKEILNNYPELLQIELAVFKSELEQFCVNHPKVEIYVDLHDSQEQNLTVEADERKGDNVPHQIRMCVFQLGAIENWKLGLFECMEHFTSTCKEDFMIDGETWVSEMVKLSIDRMEMKKKFLDPRYERVRLEVHNVRLLELQLHSASLEAHLLAIDSYLTEISNYMDKFVDDQMKCTDDLVAQIEETISERDMNALVSNQVSYLLRKTGVVIAKFMSRIDGFILDMQEDCSSKVNWLKQSTVNFLKSIKMFSEGGNYSAAEVKVLVQELVKADKYLDTQGAITKSKIAADGAALHANVRDLLEASRRKLKHLYEDLMFIEQTSSKINWLVKKMETEVSFMKYGLEILNKKKEEIEKSLTDKLSPIETTKWMELLYDLQQRSLYLIKSAGSKAYLTHVTLDHKESTPSSTDYRFFLGWDKPTEDDTFLNCVRLNLWDVFGEIQDSAHKFYLSKSEKNTVKKDVIPVNFRTFMDQLLEKCKFFLIQCEEAWIDQLKEHLVLVTKIRELANSFIKLAMEGFLNTQVGNLQEVRSTFLSNFAIKSQEQANQLAEMDRRLMPLFGYPGNRKMLADLNEQVKKSFENIVTLTLEDFFAHKANLKETRSTYEPSLRDILTIISEFCEKIFDPNLSESVALQLEEICEDSIKIIEMDRKHDERPSSAVSKRTEETSSSNDETSLIEIPIDTLIRKEIPQKYKLHIEYNSLPVKRLCNALKNILNRDLYVNKEVEPQPDCPSTSVDELSDKGSGMGSQVHVNSVVSLETAENDYEMGIYFVKPYEVEKIIDFATTEYTTKYNDCFNKLTLEIIGFKTSSKEWLKNWKENVKRVQQLYTVPYDSETPQK